LRIKTIEELRKEYEEETRKVLKKYEKHKKLFDDYHKKKVSWEDLEKHFTPMELARLENKGKLMRHKTPEQIEREKEWARRERLEAKLSPKELEIRRKFKKKTVMPISGSCWGGQKFITWGYEYTDEQIKELKKIPIEVAKKVLTPKEFKKVKREVYGE